MTIPMHRSMTRRSVLASAAGMSLLLPVWRSTAIAQEKAIAPETNPPGDIPDSQVFVTYSSPLGFSIKAPEGWSRTESADGVSFADKYGRIDFRITTGATAPTLASVKSVEAAALEKNGRAAKIEKIEASTLPSGAAVRIAYTSNSEPNAVTGKQLRLENERLLIAHGGKIATITFSAPQGADNADQWKLMRDSFRWN